MSLSRHTLLDVRASRIPEVIGSCAGGNQLLLSTVNEAQHRLLTDESQPDEGWWGTWAIILFDLETDDPYFTLPRGVARVTATDVCKKPVLLRNQFYEYLDFGNGIRPLSCSGSGLCENLLAFDRGRVVTFKDINPPNKKLRVYVTDDTDLEKRVLFSGKDAFDNIIYSQDGFSRVSGEFVTMSSPFADTTNQYTEISGIQKDITNGQIQIFEVDTVTGDETLILTMEPGETVAGYHRYFINGLPNSCCGTETTQISALCKLDFVPVVVDTDYLIIGNLSALKEECQAVRLSEMDSTEAKRSAMAHHANALRLLFGELDHFVGKERVSITVPLFGSDKLRRQVV
jgi:hypothetical protein